MSASNADRIENYQICPLLLHNLQKQQIWVKKNTYLVFSIIALQVCLIIRKIFNLSLSVIASHFFFITSSKFVSSLNIGVKYFKNVVHRNLLTINHNSSLNLS